MKKIPLLTQIAISIAALLLAGCVSEGSKPRAAQPSSVTQQTSAAPAAPRANMDDALKQAASKPPAPFPGGGWQPLFDGKTLAGWRETQFAGHGEVECRAGLIVLNMGDPFTGINYTNELPTTNYEVALDTMRMSGSDFFCGLTVPVGDSFCSLIVGGWGGSLVGISSLDRMDASENETTRFMSLESGRWYRIRLRVTEGKIQAWIDQEKMVEVVTTGKSISLRPGDIELSKPFGLSAWQTTAALREIKIRRVSSASEP